MLASIVQKVDDAIAWIKLCSAHKWMQNYEVYGKFYFC